ncbi:UNVERIFIED_CONTAM: hypothetical protein Sradi_4108600 [Sesamum radiatum]|uniref:Zinc knuckle CX2CX4HX4C domain-containing protein n=1 Tax=Sesamum radiatum TaxID=300843 RepID=A0AAW2P0Q8_SESRA
MYQFPDKRLVLRFNHVIDKRRALEGCPWSFQKNILLLTDMREEENPMKVDLNRCDFFVHVHDISLNMMNRGVATLLGNRIGVYWDMKMDAAGCAWGASLSIQVELDVTKPLKRALMIRATFGEELLARLTYERLPNIYYLCGHLGHIDKYCEVRFDEAFHDPGVETPYGLWLCALVQPRGRQQLQLQGAMASSGLHQDRPPTRTGSTIFGDFGLEQNHNNMDPKENSFNRGRGPISQL